MAAYTRLHHLSLAIQRHQKQCQKERWRYCSAAEDSSKTAEKEERQGSVHKKVRNPAFVEQRERCVASKER